MYNTDSSWQETINFTYNNDGQMLTASNTVGTMTYSYGFSYDDDGQVQSVTEPFGLSLSMTYDIYGNRTGVNDSLGGTVTSTYNSDNLLTGRTLTYSGQSLTVGLTYNSDEQLATVTRQTGMSTVGTASYSYTPAGQVQSISYLQGGSAIDSFNYAYDAAGRVTSAGSGPGVTTGGTMTYSYDGSGQLTGVSGAWANNYQYDLAGNLTSIGGQAVTVDLDNRLTSDATYTYQYDNEGNLTEKTNQTSEDTWFYTYNNANQMVSAQERTAPSGGTLEQSITYTYDAFGNLLEEDQTQGSGTTKTQFGYDGWNPAKAGSEGTSGYDLWYEYSSTSSGQTATVCYLNGDGVGQVFGRLAVSSGNATTNPVYINSAWLLTDMLGSVRDVTDLSGNFQENIQYDAYGNIVSQTVMSQTASAWLGRYTYAGMERNDATGLYYDRARFYDPGTGRFTSEDPLGFDAGDSNLYRYLQNRPSNAIDPSRFEPADFLSPTAALKYKDSIVFADEQLYFELAGKTPAIAPQKNLLRDIKAQNVPKGMEKQHAKELALAETLYGMNIRARQSLTALMSLRTNPGVKLHVQYIKGNGSNTDLEFAKHVAGAKQPGYYIYIGHGTGTDKEGVDVANVQAIKGALQNLNATTHVFFSCCFPEPINKAVPDKSRMDIIGLTGVTFPSKTQPYLLLCFGL